MKSKTYFIYTRNELHLRLKFVLDPDLDKLHIASVVQDAPVYKLVQDTSTQGRFSSSGKMKFDRDRSFDLVEDHDYAPNRRYVPNCLETCIKGRFVSRRRRSTIEGQWRCLPTEDERGISTDDDDDGEDEDNAIKTQRPKYELRPRPRPRSKTSSKVEEHTSTSA